MNDKEQPWLNGVCEWWNSLVGHRCTAVSKYPVSAKCILGGCFPGKNVREGGKLSPMYKEKQTKTLQSFIGQRKPWSKDNWLDQVFTQVLLVIQDEVDI